MQQTKKVCTQARRALGAIFRLFRGVCPLYVLERVYSGVVLPQMLYAIEVWFPGTSKWQTKLENVQRFFLQQHQNNYLQTYSELLQANNLTSTSPLCPMWLSAAQRGMELFYRFYYRLRFCPEDVLTAPRGRQSDRLNHGCAVGMTARTVTTASTFFPSCAKVWNSLPRNVPVLGATAFKLFCRSNEFVDVLHQLSSSHYLYYLKFCWPNLFDTFM